MTSALLQRLNFATQAGLRFNNERDYYAVFGYKRSLIFRDFSDKYLRQDVAKRIVNAPASATWRTPPIISSKEDENFKKAWEDLVAKNNIWSQMERADKLAGIGNYSVMLLGISDGGSTENPVRKREGNELLYIQPYSQPNAEITELDSNPRSPRFGLPSMYKVTTQDPLTTVNGTLISRDTQTIKSIELKVHHSRIIHVAEDVLENNFLGAPRLEAVFNLLDDLLKVSGGTSEVFWLTANRGMQADIDKDTELSTDDADALADELDEYQHQLRRWIRTRGVNIKNLGSDVPNPKDTFNMIISLISGATGIPRRILTGSEAGQLASDQDRANWADRINERKSNFVEPGILSPIILSLSDAGILPETKIEDIVYTWPTSFQMTPLENAQMMAQKARAAVNFAKQFKEHPIMTIEEARDILDLSEDIPPEVAAMIEEILRNEVEPSSTQGPANTDDMEEDDPDEVNGRPGQPNAPDTD